MLDKAESETVHGAQTDKPAKVAREQGTIARDKTYQPRRISGMPRKVKRLHVVFSPVPTDGASAEVAMQAEHRNSE